MSRQWELDLQVSLSCSSFVFEHCSNFVSKFVYKIIDFAKLSVFSYLIIAILKEKGIILKHTNVIVSQQMVRTASPLRKVN